MLLAFAQMLAAFDVDVSKARRELHVWIWSRRHHLQHRTLPLLGRIREQSGKQFTPFLSQPTD